MKQAVEYRRVSTEGQLDGYGLDAQGDKIRAFAEANDIEIVETFSEEAVSGTNEMSNRVAFVQMEEYLRQNPQIKTVLIYDYSRLARTVMIQERAISDLETIGVEVVSVIQPLPEEKLERDLMRTIIGAFNQYDHGKIVARLKAGRVAKAKRGGHAVGRVPLGYDVMTVDGRQYMVKNDVEAEIVEHIIYMRDEHKFSFQYIADWLNEQGYRPKTWTETNNAKFYASTVHKIYHNPKYRGIMILQENGKVVAESVNDSLKIVD